MTISASLNKLALAKKGRPAALAVVALAGLALAACTPVQEQEAVAGVNVACTALGVGSTIAVAVASKGQAQVISQQVGDGVAAACPLLVSGVTAAVNQITAQGQTATVTVTTTSPRSGRRTARFSAKMVDGRVTYTVPPNPFGLLGLPGGL